MSTSAFRPFAQPYDVPPMLTTPTKAPSVTGDAAPDAGRSKPNATNATTSLPTTAAPYAALDARRKWFALASVAASAAYDRRVLLRLPEPALALAGTIPTGRGWRFEPRLNGFRCLTCTHGRFLARSEAAGR